MADLHLIKPHMKGPAVRKLQKRLAALGLDPGVVNGEFGRFSSLVEGLEKAVE